MPSLTSADWSAVWLTFQLATVSTVILLLVGTPIAWWLARTRSKWKGVVGALVALPLVLPPTVIGFYLLVAMGPAGPVGRLTEALGLGLPGNGSVLATHSDRRELFLEALGAHVPGGGKAIDLQILEPHKGVFPVGERMKSTPWSRPRRARDGHRARGGASRGVRRRLGEV